MDKIIFQHRGIVKKRITKSGYRPEEFFQNTVLGDKERKSTAEKVRDMKDRMRDEYTQVSQFPKVENRGNASEAMSVQGG